MSYVNGVVAGPVADLEVGHRAGGYDRVMESIPDPQVPQVAKRRSFTAEYKQRILRLYEAASPAERGVLLRREGLYSSHISHWRKQRDQAAEAGQPKRGRPARNPLEVENERLKRDMARLEERLAKAEIVIDVQKKLAGLLGVDPMTGEKS